MINKVIIPILFTFIGVNLSGQTIESFIEKVNNHHPDIQASRSLLTADEAESKTDINPSDPTIRAGYFPGNNSAPGDKITWGVSQSFDFPTRYSRIKALKRTNLELAKMEYNYTYLQIMSEARSSAIELIALKEYQSAMGKRVENINSLEKAFSRMLENGETTIIEYNKIRIKQIELNSAAASLNNDIEMLMLRLDYMSSNNSNLLEHASYSVYSIPEINSLLENLKSNHPGFLIPGIRVDAAKRGLNLTKTSGLPGFEVGYSSEIVANERFTGPSLGVTVPLWKNRGKVRRSLAESEYQQKRAESDLLMLENVFINTYRSYTATEENLRIVEEALESSNSRVLLDRSLSAGEISLTEYLIELTSIYELEDIAIELRKQRQIALSKLFELDFYGI